MRISERPSVSANLNWIELSKVEDPFGSWAEENIPTGLDRSFAGDAEGAGDGDGVTNGLRYVFGAPLPSPLGGNDAGTGRIAVPPSTPADVDIVLEFSFNLSAWEPLVTWAGGAAPVFQYPDFTSIVDGIVVDTGIGNAAWFYRYRVTQR